MTTERFSLLFITLYRKLQIDATQELVFRNRVVLENQMWLTPSFQNQKRRIYKDHEERLKYPLGQKYERIRTSKKFPLYDTVYMSLIHYTCF